MQPLSVSTAFAELGSIFSNAQMKQFVDDLKAQRNVINNHVMIVKFADRYMKCPRTYQTEGQGGNAVAQFRYFVDNSECYIVELDQYGAPHHQAFGYCKNEGFVFELGYISIPELLKAGFQIDFTFVPKTVRELGLWRER